MNITKRVDDYGNNDNHYHFFHLPTPYIMIYSKGSQKLIGVIRNVKFKIAKPIYE